MSGRQLSDKFDRQIISKDIFVYIYIVDICVTCKCYDVLKVVGGKVK